MIQIIQHWKKKWSHFDLKIWVTGGTKIRWRIFEWNFTQLFSSYSESRVKILVPPVTQLFRSKWLHFFQWNPSKIPLRFLTPKLRRWLRRKYGRVNLSAGTSEIMNENIFHMSINHFNDRNIFSIIRMSIFFLTLCFWQPVRSCKTYFGIRKVVFSPPPSFWIAN